MTSVMLSCYPEVFAGGAIIAGLPYGSAANVQQAFQSMFQSPPRPARDWGDLVRKASSHQGPWPRVSVWHGDEDKTVVPSNAREILKQWADVHGLPLSPSGRTIVDGYPREVWMDEIGDEILESYTITNMAHGTPLALGDVEGACGVAGPFLLPVGISSSYHISKFFRIAARQSTPAEREIPVPAENAPARQEESAGLSGEILGKETESGSTEHHNSSLPDIGGVINKALKAAGLIRN
jgi:poly(3-hydroxybutyrate) depolymerase